MAGADHHSEVSHVLGMLKHCVCVCVCVCVAVQCKDCERWFRSKGGLAVHTCRREEDDESEEQLTIAAAVDVICSVCGRNFAWPGDLKRHKCLQERQKPVKDQQGAVQCGVCQRWLRSAGGFAVHRRTHNPQLS